MIHRESPYVFLVFGTGYIGQEIEALLKEKGENYHITRCRLENREEVAQILDEIKPTHVINTAGAHGAPNADWCEDHKEETLRANVAGAINLVDLCNLRGIHVTHTLARVAFTEPMTNKLWMALATKTSHHERGGRIDVEYGTPNDRGVRFITAFCSKPLASVVPSSEERGDCWRHDSIPGHLFCPEEVKLALQDGYDVNMGPTFIIKLKKFACGGMAISLRECHVMFDAHSILQFMRDWSAMHRAYISDISQSLPIHRYDWWASAENAPAVFLPWTQKPAELQSVKVPPTGEKMAWEDWDMKTPTSHYRVHFSVEEIDGMYASALRTSSSDHRVSRLDAIQAHIWSLINRARDLANDDDPVYWNYAINFRNRLVRPLGDDFMGNPMILAYAEMTGRKLATSSPAEIAAAIRESVATLTPETIPAMLHDHMHQICAQRYLQWFAGRRHVSATAWFHHGAQKMDFGTGRPLRMLDPRVPDYFVLMVEGEPKPGDVNGADKWYSAGIDVILNLETTVVEKILRDPFLREYQVKDVPESHGKPVDASAKRTLPVRYGQGKAIDDGQFGAKSLIVA